jgi:hypothetical protein
LLKDRFMHTGTTLTQFIIEEQRHIAGATGEFTGLLNDIVVAIKTISNAVNKGALIGVMGALESENIQGETQKKLDVITNEMMIRSNEWAGHLAGMASEEMDEVYPIPEQVSAGQIPDGVRPAGRLQQRRHQHLRRHHLLHPARAGAQPRRCRSRFPATRRQAGLRRLCAVRFFHHAGADHRPWRQRFHSGS